ncbi:MAG: hypothetical protein KDB80_15085, partial [Planctomycetes bacterium]|nr:hypothetical protein [Planctomycetota bacterium]
MSRTRILKLLVAFAGLAALLAIGLADLMLVEHDDWLERSYRNRWAFRDVPTRRGSILDRNGVVLSADEPGFDLELHYREFRRAHAVGLAVHGANLLQEAHGLRSTFRFDAPAGFEPAMRLLLDLPVRWFGDQVDDVARKLGAERRVARDSVRDVRFYVCALLEELSDGVTAPDFHVAIRRSLRSGKSGTVRQMAVATCAAIAARGHDACAFEPERFRSRVAELQDCADRLGDLDPAPDSKCDLFDFLEQRRRAWLEWDAFCELAEVEQFALRDAEFCAFVETRGFELSDWRQFAALDARHRETLIAEFEALDETARSALPRRFAVAPWNEDVPRAVRRRMPYDTAMWLRLLRDRHPGFRLRPAVRRVHGRLPGETDLGSLETALGTVTPLWQNDTGPELRNWTEGLASLGLEEF